MSSASFTLYGKRKRGKTVIAPKRNNKKRGIMGFILFILILCLCLILLCNHGLYPIITEIAKTKSQNELTYLLSYTVNRQLEEEEKTDYGDLVSINYSQDGSVSSLITNIEKINLLCTRTLLSMCEKLRENEVYTEKIPLGSVFGSDLTSAKGPDICVRVYIMRGIKAYMRSSFTEVGINQTLHRIVFVITAEMYAEMPSGKQQFSLSSEVCMAETVIVGKVPDAFTKVSRLTDDIDETDIDDVYDLGAQNYQ